MKRILLIGRWCPFHNGHKHLVDSFLKSGDAICIAIRDTGEEITAPDRVSTIEALYEKEVESDKIVVIIIPDIKGVAVGRDVGYYYVELPTPVTRISGTETREKWKRHGKMDDVPGKVVEKLKELGYEVEYPEAKGKLYAGVIHGSDEDSHGGHFNGNNKK